MDFSIWSLQSTFCAYLRVVDRGVPWGKPTHGRHAKAQLICTDTPKCKTGIGSNRMSDPGLLKSKA